MNNRVQQHFDKSIRTAINVTKTIQEKKHNEQLQQAKEKAMRLLPIIDSRLKTGIYKTQDERQVLIDLRAQNRMVLDLLADRKLLEL